MNENIIELLEKFNHIKELGYVKSVRNGNTGVGATFEYLIGKKEDQQPEPDFKGIEIKTKMYHTHTDINLFSANPSGNEKKETFRLANIYGYPDQVLKEYKVLNCCAFGNKNTLVANKFYFKLVINYITQKLILQIYDINGNLIDNSTYWNLDGLRERINKKLSTLALIHAFRKVNSNGVFYKYYKIQFYNIKNFDIFLQLIENGIIRVVFKVGVFRSGIRKGEIHDHGTSFQINEDHLELLYNILE